MNLRNVVLECSEIFGDPSYVIISEKEHMRVVYSTMVLLELQKLQDNYVDITIIYIGSGAKYLIKQIKTESEKVIVRKILEMILEKEE